MAKQTDGNYLSGITASTGKPMVYSHMLTLACAALEAGVQPLGQATQ